MNGILCINKPQEFTSFDVIAKMRGITGVRKMGHAGTLDPMATGVLPLLLGKATKACDILPDESKRYTAGFSFGKTTDTQDATGMVLSCDERPVSAGALQAALPAFVGKLAQVPPMYSAVRVGGQRLYDLARQGREVEREPRSVEVYELNLLEYCEEERRGVLDIRCSKGTYVRTLVHDLGQTLGAGGILTSLVRTESSGFTLGQCITLEEAQSLKESGGLKEHIIPVETVFRGCPEIVLSKDQTRMFLNGVRLDLNRVCYEKQKGLHRVYSPEQQFLGVARLNLQTMELRVVSFF